MRRNGSRAKNDQEVSGAADYSDRLKNPFEIGREFRHAHTYNRSSGLASLH